MTELRLEGRSAAPGMALGELVRLRRATAARTASDDPAQEAQALRAAMAAALSDLAALLAGADAEGGAILEFQVAMLEDDLLAAVQANLHVFDGLAITAEPAAAIAQAAELERGDA